MRMNRTHARTDSSTPVAHALIDVINPSEHPLLFVEEIRGRRSSRNRQYARRVQRYLRLLTRRTGGAELRQTSVLDDLLQETFVRAFSDSARAAYDGNRDL